MTDPHSLRDAHLAAVRSGGFDQPTTGLCPGFAQANLVILPASMAYDFLLFTQLNPRPCPLLGMSEPGGGSDLQTTDSHGLDDLTDTVARRGTYVGRKRPRPLTRTLGL